MPESRSEETLPLVCIPSDGLSKAPLPAPQRHWLEANQFSGALGELLALPGAECGLAGYAFGLGRSESRPALALGLASAKLRPGTYRLEGALDDTRMAALGFKLGAYRFDRFKKSGEPVGLDPEQDGDAEISALVDGAFLARDLINTPANILGPSEFESRIRDFAGERDMSVSVTAGEQLLAANFPMIHAVGRASVEAPRLIDLGWGRPDAPKVTLVGKGVTFDTGGLDIKSAAGMLLMKKDMGGAANVLGLAHAIVAAQLNVRLRVLLPIVENAISGNSFRPGDILPSRTGLNVEIGNTDAEGRLILADALALASEENPRLIIDMATLTGAARVALGPDLPPIYSNSDELAKDLVAAGSHWGDPLWHMPLWAPYDEDLTSKIADVNHVSTGGFAGSITAALFLQRFVRCNADWVHCDIYGWTPAAKAGRPQGGADQAMRAAYQVIKDRYAT